MAGDKQARQAPEPGSVAEQALLYHRRYRGKIRIDARVPLSNRDELTLAYTPGVAAPCTAIAGDPSLAYEYTMKGNAVAVVSDGTAVLGLGNLGPTAVLPVLEGKALLFKLFADIDAVPVALATGDVDAMVSAVKALAPTFGGINLEDIAAPYCFEVEQRLKTELSIPVFHDDQHGTAIVVAAALLNAARFVGKKPENLRVVINGAGAAGAAIAYFLLSFGINNIIVCDKDGALIPDRAGIEGNPHKLALARATNPERQRGSLDRVIKGADAFVGVSVAGVLTPAMVRSMSAHPIVMALANPDPEIKPALAREAGAAIVCTGRSDYPNQINNVLAFPGLFRGALDVRAATVTESMKQAAARALADLIEPGELRSDYIIPSVWDPRVVPAVAAAVAVAAGVDGAADSVPDYEEVRRAVVDRLEKARRRFTREATN